MDLPIRPIDFTIAIPTFNGSQRLSEVLDHLKRQLNPDAITWEVIVVDNNSTDNTAEVVRHYQKHWPQLRYAFEGTQGAAHARYKAVQLAASPIIGFLDDDNLPAPNWLQAAYSFAQQHPQCGVIASRISGLFEGAPPAHFDRIAAFLALTDRGDIPLIYRPEKKILPPSAGMVVRRSAWLQHVLKTPVLSGRISNSMLAGEDTEAILHIQQAGWQVWYNPEMLVEHKIPAHRLTRDYLLRLMRGIGLSRYPTRMLSVRPWLRPMMLMAYELNDIRKVCRHLLKYRLQTWTETVYACEMALYLNSLTSPLFFWKRALMDSFAAIPRAVWNLFLCTITRLLTTA
jgi:glycosyltransferase involved in cell wall biosynthesis